MLIKDLLNNPKSCSNLCFSISSEYGTPRKSSILLISGSESFFMSSNLKINLERESI